MYPATLREEEIKNKVAADVFGDYDSPDAEYTRLIGDLRAAMKTPAAQIAPKVRAHGFLK